MYSHDSSVVGELYSDAYGRAPDRYFWAIWNMSTDSEREDIWIEICDALNERAYDGTY